MMLLWVLALKATSTPILVPQPPVSIHKPVALPLQLVPTPPRPRLAKLASCVPLAPSLMISTYHQASTPLALAELPSMT